MNKIAQAAALVRDHELVMKLARDTQFTPELIRFTAQVVNQPVSALVKYAYAQPRDFVDAIMVLSGCEKQAGAAPAAAGGLAAKINQLMQGGMLDGVLKKVLAKAPTAMNSTPTRRLATGGATVGLGGAAAAQQMGGAAPPQDPELMHAMGGQVPGAEQALQGMGGQMETPMQKAPSAPQAPQAAQAPKSGPPQAPSGSSTSKMPAAAGLGAAAGAAGGFAAAKATSGSSKKPKKPQAASGKAKAVKEAFEMPSLGSVGENVGGVAGLGLMGAGAGGSLGAIPGAISGMGNGAPADGMAEGIGRGALMGGGVGVGAGLGAMAGHGLGGGKGALIGMLLGGGAGALGGHMVGNAGMAAGKKKKEEEKMASFSPEVRVMRRVLVKKAGEIMRQNCRAIVVSHLDKVASCLPLEKQAAVRTMQAELSHGKPLSFAIKTAYPHLNGEQRGILGYDIVRTAQKAAMSGLPTTSERSYTVPAKSSRKAMSAACA